ncbi:MAG: aspartate--tRNA(Asn) ligase [bacterium]
MSTRLLIKDAVQKQGTVTVAGWARNIRVHKGVTFIDLRDISGQIQLVFEAGSEASKAIDGLSMESVVEAVGKIQPKPAKKDSKEQEFEVLVESAKILSKADQELPIPVLTKADNEADIENRFNYRWLDLRQPEHQQIFKVWTELEKGFREYWDKSGYIQIYTPTFMNTASESGAEVFAVKYFDRQAYLAQSPQFYKQMAMASGLEKVFAIGPVYRAEKSYTNRHNTEFTGWDFEISYIESDDDVMQELENMIIMGFEQVKESLNMDIDILPPFPRITMKQAKDRLSSANLKSEQKDNLSAEEEAELGRIMKKETGHDFFFLTHYPFSVRPFYHMKQDNDSSLTKSFDLFYKGLEIVTGAQREHRYDVLKKQAEEKGMELEPLEDYFNFFKFGCPPHGGVGIGPARIIMKLLDLPNIREAVLLPRDVRRLRP